MNDRAALVRLLYRMGSFEKSEAFQSVPAAIERAVALLDQGSAYGFSISDGSGSAPLSETEIRRRSVAARQGPPPDTAR